MADGRRPRADGRPANPFRVYAPEKIPYAVDRYTNEVNRLFGVMNRRLGGHEYLAGFYRSPTWPRHGLHRLDERLETPRAGDFRFPRLAQWFDAALASPAVRRRIALDIQGRKPRDLSTTEEARKILFGKRGRED